MEIVVSGGLGPFRRPIRGIARARSSGVAKRVPPDREPGRFPRQALHAGSTGTADPESGRFADSARQNLKRAFRQIWRLVTDSRRRHSRPVRGASEYRVSKYLLAGHIAGSYRL